MQEQMSRKKTLGILLMLIGTLTMQELLLGQDSHAFCQHTKQMSIRSAMDESDNARSDTINILHQELNLAIIDFVGHTISGNCISEIESKMDGVNVINFDLLDFVIDSIHGSNDEQLGFSYDNSIVSVYPAQEFNEGDLMSITIFYHGEPSQDDSGWGGFYWLGGYAFNLGVGFAAEPHNYGRAWYPCFDNFAERCTYEFNIKTADGKNAWCNGFLSNTENLGGDTLISTWMMEEEIPSYLVSVAVADYTAVEQSFESTSGNDVPIYLTARASDTSDVASSFINLIPCLHGFEDRYGPYRWSRVGYAFVPFNSGAMEHATNIAYPISFASGNLSFQTLMAHELAHHWWGDLVTCRTKEDMWINEGMASYSEALFLEWIEGVDSYKEHIRANHRNVILNAHVNDGAVLPVSGIDTENTYGDHVYNKGADMAHNLRAYMGDDDFFAGLSDFLEENQFQSVTSQQLRDFLNSYGDADLISFFDNWIFEPGYCEISIDSYTYSENGGAYEVDVDFRQKLHKAPEFYGNVPVFLTIMDEDMNSELVQLIGDGEYSSSSFSTSVEPHRIFLNFENELSMAILSETVEIGDTGFELLNFSDFTIEVEELDAGDTLWLRVENHLVAAEPDQNQLEFHMADDRFWRIGGFFPETMIASGRIEYYGNPNDDNAIDALFFENLTNAGMTEDSLVLVYRPTAEFPWQEYDDYYVNVQGSTTNMIGRIEFEDLKAGDYAWAYYTGGTSIQESNDLGGLKSWPNPFTNKLSIELPNDATSVKIYDSQGKLVYSQDLTSVHDEIQIHTGKWKSGEYFVELRMKSGACVKSAVVKS